MDEELDRVNRYVLILLVGIMTLTVFLGVVSRGVNVSVTWTQEVSEFAFVWLSLLGMAAVFKRKGHIIVDAANSLMPEKMLADVKFLGEATMILFFALLTYSGIELGVINYATKSPVLELSVGLHYLSIPIACLLMMLNQLSRLFGKLAHI
jgi:TRAP-type C4-dicarboxylate transport system permease small subunit